MEADASKSLVRKYIEEVWNNADAAAFDELTNGSYTYHLGGQPPRDKSAMQKFLQSVHAAFPDWRVRVEDIVAEGNTVAVRWIGEATHQCPFHGVPPTGKQISVCGINLYKIENDKISQEWEQMDSLGMLQQLGLISSSKS